MAYKVNGQTGSLRDILARVNGEVTIHKPVVYCTSDIVRAKSVLDRLLEQAANCEVSRIKPISREVEEI